MRKLILSLAAILLANPVFALSCMPYGVTNAWHDASDSPEDYIVVHGVLTFDSNLLPKVDMDNQGATPPETLIPAHMKGYALTTKGFTKEFDQDIILNVGCFGPWCGGALSGVPYLGFLKKSGSKFQLDTDPCGGFAFGKPSKELLQQVITCQRGGTCKKIKLP